MNWKRWAITVFAVFATVFVTDFIIHGWLLKGTYEATSHLWRPQEEMGSYMPWMFLGQFGVGMFLAWIFSKGYEGKGWMEGVRFGALVWGFWTANQFVMYAVQPYPFSLLMSWMVTGLVQMILCGIVASLVWKGAVMKRGKATA